MSELESQWSSCRSKSWTQSACHGCNLKSKDSVSAWNRTEVKANVFTLQMQSMETCLECRGANVVCVLSTFGSVWLQGLEIQPASPVLPAHRGHPGLPEPSAGETRVRRNLWGPMPQLHARTPAQSLLPADLCAGVGEIQRGKGARPCCLSLPPTSFPVSLSTAPTLFYPLCFSRCNYPLCTRAWSSVALSHPPVTRCNKLDSRIFSAH